MVRKIELKQVFLSLGAQNNQVIGPPGHGPGQGMAPPFAEGPDPGPGGAPDANNQRNLTDLAQPACYQEVGAKVVEVHNIHTGKKAHEPGGKPDLED